MKVLWHQKYALFFFFNFENKNTIGVVVAQALNLSIQKADL